jgi:hypothetical protein
MKWIGEFVAKRGAPTFWEVWQAACEVSNRTPASNEVPPNDQNTPLGDAGKLVETAQAVIDRWDSPHWKDLPHTANYINALRQALSTHLASKGDGE